VTNQWDKARGLINARNPDYLLTLLELLGSAAAKPRSHQMRSP
jgi:hypothetical protein